MRLEKKRNTISLASVPNAMAVRAMNHSSSSMRLAIIAILFGSWEWTVTKTKWRSLTKPIKAFWALALGALTIAGFLIALPSSGRPYPWFLPVTEFPDASKIVRQVALHVYVRDEPLTAEQKRGAATISSLDDLHVTVDVPMAVDADQDAWRSCRVLDFHVPEWNNDAAPNPLAQVNLEKDTTILDIRATARNGHWSGALLLKRQANSPVLLKEIVLRGSLVSHWWQKGTMSVAETHDGRSVSYTTEDIFPLTKDKLMKYGIPVISTADARQHLWCTVTR